MKKYALCLFLVFGFWGIAQDKTESGKGAGPAPEPKQYLRKGRIKAGGAEIAYTARAEETLIRDDKDQPIASMFSISYIKDGVKDPASRPVTFVFNGGPGSSAVWLHMGLMGPKKVVVPSDASFAGNSPYQLADNPDSLLNVTDLVFIDPVGTGYSRAIGEAKNEDFWGFNEDARSVAEFMRLFVTKNKRWNSPKYIAGESYGTIRAALLVGELQGNFKGIHLNGVILIAPALNIATLIFAPGNELPFVTYLPTYAATAWYHKQLPEQPAELEPFLEEVREFARTEYLTALFKGDSLSENEFEAVVDKLHRFTGLKKDYLRKTNLRIYVFRFFRELLRDRGLVVGRLDSRYTGTEADDAGEFPGQDPAGTMIEGAFVAGFLDYMTRDLTVDLEREYEILSLEANQAWKRPPNQNNSFSGFIDVTPTLAEGTRINPHMRVFVANGIYDLATTFFSSEYIFNHSGIDKDRLQLVNYPSGHMMYLHEPSLKQLAADLRAFISAR